MVPDWLQEIHKERLLTRSYDALYDVLRSPSGDVAFYVDIAREAGGPVLELGCGTGRVLLPIACLGLECVGVDLSGEMLRLFREKNPPNTVCLVQAFMESFQLNPLLFQCVLLPFHSFSQLLNVVLQEQVLQRIWQHMAPGGVLAFDIFDPTAIALRLRAERDLISTFRIEGRVVKRQEFLSLDSARRLLHVRYRFMGSSSAWCGDVTLDALLSSPEEITYRLNKVGFERVMCYANFNRKPWEPGQEMVFVAHKPLS